MGVEKNKVRNMFKANGVYIANIPKCGTQTLLSEFSLCSVGCTDKRVLAWLAKWGIVGIALAWLWSNALAPLLKKFGVF